ncbi:hypothetical protein [Variovorax sp. dw_308]|uniref:hypothetical protein n=1 Tax=Variovorax sp. dw_308 TaxID=2721546 RepID=UPI001C48F8A4|nr:hypothetical protein [Variovorax sp. dw_308]
MGELLADIPRLGEEISRAYKAAKPEDLATVFAELDALVTELEAAWKEVAPSTSRD